VREHSEATNTFDFVPLRQTITTEYPDDTIQDVTLHDNSIIHLHKHHDAPDITDRRQAIDNLEDHKAQEMILTGVLYINPDSSDTHEILNTCERPLNSLSEADLCPGSGALEAINDGHR
jgi:2-oxoglutarate ferredoxin oxidoreductase subunit beta